MPKRSIQDEFEAIYLRENDIKKYTVDVDHAILKDKEFERISIYMAKRFCDTNKDLLACCGFDYDDVHNVVRIYGLTFHGYEKRFEGRNKNMIMMRYISQRLNNLLKWMIRKYSTDETVSMQHNLDSVNSEYTPYIEAAELEDETFEVPMPESQFSVKEMRQKIMSEPEKYKDLLCYYATTKHVGRDMRMKARLFCKKLNIDYVAWCKERSARLNQDKSHYTF